MKRTGVIHQWNRPVVAITICRDTREARAGVADLQRDFFRQSVHIPCADKASAPGILILRGSLAVFDFYKVQRGGTIRNDVNTLCAARSIVIFAIKQFIIKLYGRRIISDHS